MRAAIYVRVSSEDQAHSGYGIASQIELCRKKAIQLGANTIAEFADEGVSGSVLARPGLSALRESVKAGLVDVVIALDPDRLSRSLSHQLLLAEEIEKRGVRMEFVDFEWKSTPEGQLFYALKGAIAQYEREKIRERTTRGRLQKAKSGRLPSGFEPYGYTYDPATGCMTIHPFESEVVRWIFSWFIEDGMSPGEIAKRLTHMGVPTKRGAAGWHRGVVNQIIRNPVYTGVFYANRYSCTDIGLNRYRPPEERVRVRLRPREEWIPVAVPVIVERRLWEEAQERIRNARRLWAGSSGRPYLLSGLVLCGDCAAKMSGSVLVRWGRRNRYYVCAGRKRPGKEKCPRTVEADLAEGEVWGQIRELLGDPSSEEWEDCEKNMMGRLDEEVKRVAFEMAKLKRARARLLSRMDAGLVTPRSVTREYLERLDSELRCLEVRESELAAIRASGARSTAKCVAGDGEKYISENERARERVKLWLEQGGLPPERARDIVRHIVESVVVRAGEIEIRMRVGPPPAGRTLPGEGDV